MKGHSLAWADPNSTSGYLIPSATLKAKGIKLDDGAYFSKTGFSGGHEQGVVAVLNKQYDGAVTWTSGQGEKSEGYTRGNLRSMVDKKMLKMSDVNIIWQSGKIPNGPWAVRIALPAELKKQVTEFMLDLPKSHKDVYDDVERGSGVGYAPATMELYKTSSSCGRPSSAPTAHSDRGNRPIPRTASSGAVSRNSGARDAPRPC